MKGIADSYGPGGPASTAGLSPLGALVRRRDPDRFLSALFAPPAQRETLFTLYAFNAELARAWDVTSHPMLALFRLQWWREVLEGADRRHEVATPLAASLAAGHFAAAELEALIAAREAQADGFFTLSDWQGHAAATAGRLARLAGGVLGADTSTVARLAVLGTAYGASGVLRAAGQPLRAAPELAAWARELLGPAARLPRGAVSAGLVGVLARRDLRRPGRTAVRGLGDRLAVSLAALRCRV